MRYILLTMFCLLLSCQTNNEMNTDISSDEPNWIELISQNEITAEAEILKRIKHNFDESVFKLKPETTSAIDSPANKTDLNNAINVIINNGQNTKPEKENKISLSRIESIYNNSLGLSGGKFIIGYIWMHI